MRGEAADGLKLHFGETFYINSLSARCGSRASKRARVKHILTSEPKGSDEKLLIIHFDGVKLMTFYPQQKY